MKKHTQKKVGRGWHGDKSGHARAGQLGGLTTASVVSETFYSEIGRIGGRMSSGNFKNDPERAKIAGQKGGKSKAQKSL